ncbi:MAG: OmpA family protein [Paludibacteraceae bacterium]|nr:OmpA family protein [Paludibacteraceae bacterium]MBN2787976.1 OmpA family protein [Paludibacteraceae bacterium]
MKRKLLLVVAAATLISSSFAQTSELAKWSVGLKGGLNSVRGAQYSSSPFDRPFNLAAGLFVERSINPFFGLGLDYMYMGNNIDGVTGFTVAQSSTIHDIQATTSINLSNLVAKYRSIKKQKFNTYFVYGIGTGIWTGNVKPSGSEITLASSFGVNFTYNVSKSLELGLETKYQWHSEAQSLNLGSKDFYVVDLNLRYKFKGVSNTRNISLTDFEKMNSRREGTQEAIDRLQYELARQAESIKKLEARESSDSIDGVAIKDIIMGQQYQMDQLTKQLTKTRKDLYRHLNATDPNYLTGDSTQYDLTTCDGFKTGSYVLTPKAHIILDTIASQLKENTAWTVKIKGHTDNVGSDAINQRLSLKRAEAVKTYLVKKSIEAKRISTEGLAATKPIVCNDDEASRAKNRRVEIIVNK